MADLCISLKNIEKIAGSKRLFEGLSLGLFDRDRVALIGPNGAGKSTLLRLMSQTEKPDGGEVVHTSGLRVAYVSQSKEFVPSKTLVQQLTEHLQQNGWQTDDAHVQAAITLSIVGFDDIEKSIGELSGGWQKRLTIAEAIAIEPDVLLLDEPTNHMDWDGVLWLESWLKGFKKTFVLISHDRQFLENVTTKTIEIHPVYKDGYLSLDCSYTEFLEKKEEYIKNQLQLQESLANKVRRETEWLRAGVKARTTKSQSRMQKAYEAIDTLADVKSRSQSAKSKARIEFDATGRRAKKLIELEGVSVGYDDKVLGSDISITLGPKQCLGVLGSNGSGKSTLLKVILKKLQPLAGTVFHAEQLQTLYFDQQRQDINPQLSLMEYLADGGDYVVFNGQSVHVGAYARRFLFSSDKLTMKIESLSGGEKARLLIAKRLLQPTDILVLDEPTNDLDIDTIEVLIQALDEFPGLIILVSHDRHFLTQLCDSYLGFVGQGVIRRYASVDQWIREWTEAATLETVPTPANTPKNIIDSEPANKTFKRKPKLSYKDKKRLETIEDEIQAAEAALESSQQKLSDPTIMADPEKLNEAIKDTALKQAAVDDCYAFWESMDSLLASES